MKRRALSSIKEIIANKKETGRILRVQILEYTCARRDRLAADSFSCSARARFVLRFPSCNYLQVTYLKRTSRECTSHRGRSYMRYVSVPAFMSSRRGRGFAFNCERDSSQPEGASALFKMRMSESTLTVYQKIVI